MNYYDLIAGARSSVEAFLRSNETASTSEVFDADELALLRRREECFGRQPIDHPESADVKGVFVTVWSFDDFGAKRLRGCIGRHVRLFNKLQDEVADCAISSAVDDPRFPPLELSELPNVRFEISLLMSSERVLDFETELDPKVFGIIVRSGFKQATLLPNTERIETSQQQLRAAKQRAGIEEREAFLVYRFKVINLSEGSDFPQHDHALVDCR